MAKVAIIADTHFGARNDNRVFLQHFEDFFNKTFFPYLEKNNIKHILHLGDVFDRRKYVNFVTLHAAKTCFIDKLKDYSVDIIVGNHDIYWRNTNRLNSPMELMGDSSNCRVYDKATHIDLYGMNVLLVPWITPENSEETMEVIKKSSACVCFGHLEIRTYLAQKGSEYMHGLKPEIFSGFSDVFSGHFHFKQKKNNISYVGSPYQMTWADWSTPKGFHIFDTSNGEMEFIQNEDEMFFKVVYGDDDKDILEKDFKHLYGKYVKVIASGNRKDAVAFDHLINNIYTCAPAMLNIVEGSVTADLAGDQSDDPNDLSKDSVSLINDYIDSIPNIDEHKPHLKKMAMEIHVEALTELNNG